MTHEANVAPITIWDEADLKPWWEAGVDVTARFVRSITAACAAVGISGGAYDLCESTQQTSTCLDLRIAIDLNADLVVPAMHDITNLDEAEFRRTLDVPNSTARASSVEEGEFNDPTILLLHYGMFVGRLVALILAPPQSAIVGAGRVARQTGLPGRDGRVLVSNFWMPVWLTFDPRSVADDRAARFLRAMIDDLEGEG